MIKKPKIINKEGMNSHETQTLLSLLARANLTQLFFITRQVAHEIEKRHHKVEVPK